ncbi:MAG TPA: uroporphyrinogen-III C-methyltransferase [Phycisphaerae bacterium]|nr:uroporphyrinogen-III C-methyltransferase [Phycisphaerae bacterium]
MGDISPKKSNTYNQPLVYLVGAGPGDPGLITAAGAEILARAAVVIYDALANPLLLDLCPSDTKKIFAGKSADHHTLSQDQINQLLVNEARHLATNEKLRGRVVVRLKGGDPYVFGRGAEEALELFRAGINFQVIPGITAGIAGPCYAGIPVTHRDLASTVTFITGHQQDASDDSTAGQTINYAALARLGGTLVFYMGVKSLPDITAKLVAAGMDPNTPAAVVRMATHQEQKTIRSTLQDIAQTALNADIKPPAITIVGNVISMNNELNWFEKRPLFGKTILVTRTRHQASKLSSQFTSLGAGVIEAPTIELAPAADTHSIDRVLIKLKNYHCVVFTSANGVEAAWERMRKLNLDARAFPNRVAAVGEATAEALGCIGIAPDIVPEEFISENLAADLIQRLGDSGSKKLDGIKFALLRADIARPNLLQALLNAGAQVDDVPIYSNVLPKVLATEALEALKSGRVDWVTFTSGSTAKNLHALLPENLREVVKKSRRLSIGPITTQALVELGWPPTIQAGKHDISGMVDALLKYEHAVQGKDDANGGPDG